MRTHGLVVACAAVVAVASGCGGSGGADYERYQLAYDGIPYFRDDSPSFNEESFDQFASDTCDLSDDQLGQLYDAEGNGTSTYMLLAFACGDDVADRAIDASSEDIDSRRYIREEYDREWSSVEKTKARIAEARKSRCPEAVDDPTCPGS